MTNKKFKVAAMSMALTACVAAQPLIANAADDVNAVSNDAPDSASQSEGESTASVPVADASSSDNQNHEADDAKEAFGENVDVNYHPETKNEDGSTTATGDIVKKIQPETEGDGQQPEGGGQQTEGNGQQTEGNGQQTETDLNNEQEGPKDGDNETEKKPIGEANKTEKDNPPTTETTIKPGAESIPDESGTRKEETTENPDGSVDIKKPTLTPGTETSTTTGTGTATGTTSEDEYFGPEQVDLEKELGDASIDWDAAKKGAAVGESGYKIHDIESTDNSQTLTLVKEDPVIEGEMTAEDIAKLVDAKASEVDSDGYYTLTRTETYKDENGNEQTRTTYIKVKEGDSHVTIRTTTKLVVSRERETHTQPENNTVEVQNEFKLPDITMDNNETITSEKLQELLNKAGANDPTVPEIYNVEDGDREYTITVNKAAADKLSAEEIADYLGDDYKAEGGKVYYVGKGQHAELSVDQEKVVRERLSYTVKVKETKTGEAETIGSKAEAENAARTEATKAALTKALVKMGLTEEQAKAAVEDNAGQINPTDGGDFVYVKGDKTYTLHYKGAEVSPEVSTPVDKDQFPDKVPDKDPDKIDNVQSHVVNGSTYVTSGTISWEKSETSTNGTHTAGSSFTVPKGFAPESSKTEDGVTTTTYVKETCVGNTVTRETYVVTERDVTLDLTPEQKEELAWKNLLTQHPEYSSIEDLKAAGYKVVNYNFDNVKQVDWSVSKTTSSTTTTTDDTDRPLVDSNNNNWKIEENAASDPSQAPTYTITIDGTPYENVTKNADGTYTCTRDEARTEKDEAGNSKTVTRSVTYTFTEASDGTLTDAEIQGMLAGEFDIDAADTEEIGKITLDKASNTATYTSKTGETTTTITINYSSLSRKKLDVKKEVHGSTNGTAVVKTDDDYQAYCQTLLKRIKDEILPTLAKDEKLFVGDIEITGETTLTDEIIAYFKKAISPEDMDPDEIVKALKEQERIAKSTTVTVNEGNKYQEELKNYYSGADAYYVKPDGSRQELDYDQWKGKYYYRNSANRKIYPDPKDIVHADTIGHLDLASGSQLELLPEEGQTKGSTVDCVLVSKGLELKWNYDADQLVKTGQGTTVGLQSTISKDTEDGKSSHFEYDRGDPNNNPSKSAFYKLTGTVVYDAVKTEDNKGVKLYEKGEAFHDDRLEYNYYYNYYNADEGLVKAVNDYLEGTRQTGKTYDNLSKEELNDIIGTYVVELGHTQNNKKGPVGYQVYLKSSSLEAYGYMSRDANTCVNKTYRNQNDGHDGYYDYSGGYDLMISNLIQVREGKVIGSTESTVKNISALWSIRSAPEYKMNSLLANRKNTTTNTTTDADAGRDSRQSGDFSYTYQYTHPAEEYKWNEDDTTGTGTGNYISFVNLIHHFFSGESKPVQKDSGSFTYEYNYTTETPLQTQYMVKTTEKKATVGYSYKTVEQHDVMIPTWDIIHIDPEIPDDDGDDEIIEEKTPDSSVLPGTPELPPVQDAKPDAPVLPADPVLPAVQDAHALPQTGVNWLAAIGLALSGMTLMITGAFASLLGKNAKH